jgi:aquaporin Z
MEATPTKRFVAELIGTLWLVLGGCGTAVISGHSVGFVGVALAFGLSFTTMAYALGSISGAHFNPAVTVGLATAGRFPWKDVPSYVIAQLLGAIDGAAILYVIARGAVGFDASASGFASNGYGIHSPSMYGALACAVCEIVLTCVFVLVVLGATDRLAPLGFGPLAIGLALTAVHLVSIPVTNTSVNPARSTGPAIFQGGWALGQLWLFWLAPIAGAIVGAFLYRAMTSTAPTLESAGRGPVTAPKHA